MNISVVVLIDSAYLISVCW